MSRSEQVATAGEEQQAMQRPRERRDHFHSRRGINPSLTLRFVTIEITALLPPVAPGWDKG